MARPMVGRQIGGRGKRSAPSSSLLTAQASDAQSAHCQLLQAAANSNVHPSKTHVEDASGRRIVSRDVSQHINTIMCKALPTDDEESEEAAQPPPKKKRRESGLLKKVGRPQHSCKSAVPFWHLLLALLVSHHTDYMSNV